MCLGHDPDQVTITVWIVHDDAGQNKFRLHAALFELMLKFNPCLSG
jgi:hypothetical protein